MAVIWLSFPEIDTTINRDSLGIMCYNASMWRRCTETTNIKEDICCTHPTEGLLLHNSAMCLNFRSTVPSMISQWIVTPHISNLNWLAHLCLTCFELLSKIQGAILWAASVCCNHQTSPPLTYTLFACITKTGTQSGCL